MSAGYLSNSWVVFALQHIRYEASLHKEISDIDRHRRGVQPDQAGRPTSRTSSRKNVEPILYWPVDEKAIQPALEKAAAKGIPTVNVGGGFADPPGTVSNAYIDQ